jgi:hypothetical protein
MASKKKYVISKQGKFATVAGGLGALPKVYTSIESAKYDIASNPKLKGGLVQPYVDPDVPVEAAAPMATTTKPTTGADATATTSKKAAGNK